MVAYWAMATVNRSLPAVTTSLGILATPVVGTLGSAIALAEPIGMTLLVAMALILGGIAVGTTDRRRWPPRDPPPLDGEGLGVG